MINIAIIGAGNIALQHIKAYQKMNGVRLKYVMDVDERRAKKMAEIANAESTNDLQVVLNDKEIEIVDICVPTFLHLEIVKEAAKAKKDIICEKPVALSVEDAKRMYSVCRENGVDLHIGQVCRFMSGYKKIATAIKENKLGKIGMVRMTRAVQFPVQNGQIWYKDDDKSGGAFVDFIIHDFDFITWCFGQPDSISSYQIKSDGMEGIMVTMSFQNGPLIRVEGIWTAILHHDLHQRIEVEGLKGYATYDTNSTVPWEMGTESEKVKYEKSEVINDHFYDELYHFIQCTQGAEEPFITEEEVVTTLETALRCKEDAVVNWL